MDELQKSILSAYANMFQKPVQQPVQQTVTEQPTQQTKTITQQVQTTKYVVTVQRTSWADVTFQVQAESEKQAQQIALKKAANADFSDQDGFQYQIFDCYRVD